MGYVNFAFSNRDRVLSEFNQWVAENPTNTLDGAVLNAIGSGLKYFDNKLENISKGFICKRVTSPRLLETVSCLAKKILDPRSSKIKKFDQFQVYYGLTTQIHYDKDGRFGIMIDPRAIAKSVPTFKASSNDKTNVEQDLLFCAKFIEKQLIHDPTILNFLVGRELVHYKYDDYPILKLKILHDYFKYYRQQKTMNAEEGTLARAQIVEQHKKYAQDLELSADRKALSILGTAKNTIKWLQSQVHDIADEHGSFPSHEVRIKEAEKYLKVADVVPKVQLSFLENLSETFLHAGSVIGIL